MRTLIVIGALGALGVAPAPPAAPASREKPIRVAATCFFQYEQDAGQNKICWYDCLGQPVAITIRSTALCPLSIAH